MEKNAVSKLANRHPVLFLTDHSPARGSQLARNYDVQTEMRGEQHDALACSISTHEVEMEKVDCLHQHYCHKIHQFQENNYNLIGFPLDPLDTSL